MPIDPHKARARAAHTAASRARSAAKGEHRIEVVLTERDVALVDALGLEIGAAKGWSRASRAAAIRACIRTTVETYEPTETPDAGAMKSFWRKLASWRGSRSKQHTGPTPKPAPVPPGLATWGRHPFPSDASDDDVADGGEAA